MMTESGGILCQSGHGKVLSNREITAMQLKNAVRDRDRWAWLSVFPEGVYVTKRKYRIAGKIHVTAIPQGRKTSKLPWLEKPLEGYLVAHCNGRARYFSKVAVDE